MTTLLIFLAIAAVAAILYKLDRIDTRRCAEVNKGIVSLNLASRAASPDECPDEFLAKLQAVLAAANPAADGDEVPR